MKLFNASDARRRFGRLLETARRGPVTITKNGHAAAMLIPTSDNQLISVMEGFLKDRYRGERIADAERGGHIGLEKSNRTLSEALNAES